jgi:peptidoglycan/xylan/chitin deacetylase (PgdA/CDA1 family)
MSANLPPVRRLGDEFRWPGGRRVALVFNIAYEGWSEGQAPGIGPMGNVLKPGFFDTNAHSWATFGAVRGIDRLLDIADRRKITTSVMVNGVLAEKYPHTVRRIHESGHEVLAHSWGMDVIPVYLDEAQERANLHRTVDAITAVTGVKPVGWISPRGTGSPITPRILAEEGFLWHGDCNDDDLPTVQEFGARPIVGISLTMDVNDLPWCIRYGNPPGGLLETFRQTLDAARTRERRALVFDATAHTHVFGRSAGAWVFEDMMKHALQFDDVWIATRAEIARHVLETLRQENPR